MPRTRKIHAPGMKARVALEAIKSVRTIGEIAQEHAIHPTLVTTWKKQAVDGLPGLFESPRDASRDQQSETERDELFKQIGQLKVELDWVKKKAGFARRG